MLKKRMATNISILNNEQLKMKNPCNEETRLGMNPRALILTHRSVGYQKSTMHSHVRQVGRQSMCPHRVRAWQAASCQT